MKLASLVCIGGCTKQGWEVMGHRKGKHSIRSPKTRQKRGQPASFFGNSAQSRTAFMCPTRKWQATPGPSKDAGPSEGGKLSHPPNPHRLLRHINAYEMNSPQISQQWTKIQQYQAIHLKVPKPNFIFSPKYKFLMSKRNRRQSISPH